MLVRCIKLIKSVDWSFLDNKSLKTFKTDLMLLMSSKDMKYNRTRAAMVRQEGIIYEHSCKFDTSHFKAF